MKQQTFGQYLRALRNTQGVTQAQLAQRAQVSIRAISYWEKEEFTPRSSEVQAVLAALGVPVQEQTNVLLKLMPLRGDNIVRHDTTLHASGQEVPLPGAGDLLTAMRLRKGWSYQQSAEQLRIAPTTLSRWEKNQYDISAEMLPVIQSVFQASDAEIEGLRRRLILAAEAEEPFSLERCKQWVDAVESHFYTPGFHSIDLEVLALQRKLWLLEREHPEVRNVLARLSLYYGVWLVMQNRGREVHQQAQRALNIYAKDMSEDSEIVSALNLLSWCKGVWMGPKPEQGERFLRRWLTTIQRPSARIHLLADLSFYAANAGNTDMALRYLHDARRLYEKPGNATEDMFRYQQITRARVLLYSGKPVEAYNLLARNNPVTEKNFNTHKMAHILIFIETMLAAKERNMAQTWLDAVFVRMEGLHLPALRTKADALACQL